ncbi:MAG TPA: T9SS type A sorting domain-containing protein [Candidatus Kapabacteria bacterium]|nr:T9SS type A sorting domain-containing protein [Candidatus Kapabacteria bacterium]
MKKQLLILILFLITLQVSYSQEWKIVFDHPTYSLLVKGDTLFAGSNLSIVWYSTDNGDTWNWEKFVGYPSANISILATDSNNIFAAKKDGLFISRDNGKEWQKAKLPDSAERFSPLAVNKNYAFIALTYGELWYSSDYGSTWQENNLDACISALGWKGDTLFAGGNQGIVDKIWMSIDYGATWDTIKFKYNVSSFAFKGDSIFVGRASGLYLTSDFGKSWKEVFPEGILKSFIVRNDTLVIGWGSLGPPGFTISTDGGEKWLYSYIIHECTDIILHNGYLFVSTDEESNWCGITRYKWSDIMQFVRFADVKDEQNKADLSIYPNPAGDYIYINSPLIDGIGGEWEYQIYDLLGNCVQSGVIESDKINISQLSSGFYTVRFFNGGKQVVVKMMKE